MVWPRPYTKFSKKPTDFFAPPLKNHLRNFIFELFLTFKKKRSTVCNQITLLKLINLLIKSIKSVSPVFFYVMAEHFKIQIVRFFERDAKIQL